MYLARTLFTSLNYFVKVLLVYLLLLLLLLLFLFFFDTRSV